MEEMDENVVVLPVLPLRGMMVFPYMSLFCFYVMFNLLSLYTAF